MQERDDRDSVVRAVDSIPWRMRSTFSRRRTMERVLRAYMVFGVLASVLGVGYFLLTLVADRLTWEQSMSLIVAGIGALLGITSRFMLSIRRQSEAKREQEAMQLRDLYLFLDTWMELEEAAHSALVRRGIGSVPSSIGRTATLLLEEGLLSASQGTFLREALILRNSVVHEGNVPPPDFMEPMLSSLQNVIKELNST